MYVFWKCPKPTRTNSFITFQDKSGFQNPFEHLGSCHGRGESLSMQIRVLKNLSDEASKSAEKVGGTICGHFQCDALSEFEKNADGYLSLIVLRSTRSKLSKTMNIARLPAFRPVIPQRKSKRRYLNLFSSLRTHWEWEAGYCCSGHVRRMVKVRCEIRSDNSILQEGGCLQRNHERNYSFPAVPQLDRLSSDGQTPNKDREKGRRRKAHRI